METKPIVQTVRSAIGLAPENVDFKEEVEMYINAALGILGQIGVGIDNFTLSDESTWNDFKNPIHIKGNRHFHMVPLYVMTRTKLLFDPPPPSTVEFYSEYIKELIWRLKIGYEEDEL